MSELRLMHVEAKVGSFTVSLPELSVREGELVCLMGKSGSGKTTLLNAIAGFSPDANGSISWNGQPLAQLPPEKRRMAFVFQRAALFPHLTVLRNVEFGLSVQRIPSEARKVRAGEWLKRLGIADLAERFPNQISEGQSQRVSIARALAPGFPLLLLDEPFSALDVATRAQMRELLRELVKEAKIAAVMVTHHPEDALAIADKIVVLEEGKVIWSGKPRDAQNPYLA